MLFIVIPKIKINPVKKADNKLNVTKRASNFGNRQRFISKRIIGAIMKYKNMENTKGTSIVFIEYNAKVIAIELKVIKLAGMILSLNGVMTLF